MANGKINFGKQSGGVLGLLFPDGATNTEVTLPESGTLATTAGATESAQGLIELATTAETQTGTDDTRAITPLKLKNSVLGLGQTWQDVTASRLNLTTYTNTTGKPIMVNVVSSYTANADIKLYVGGIMVSAFLINSTVQAQWTVSAIVPNNTTYSIDKMDSTSFTWYELR